MHPGQTKNKLETAMRAMSHWTWLWFVCDECGEFPSRSVILTGFPGSSCDKLSCLLLMSVKFHLLFSSVKWNEMENFEKSLKYYCRSCYNLEIFMLSTLVISQFWEFILDAAQVLNQPGRLSFKLSLFYSKFFMMIFHSGNISGRPTVCLCLYASEKGQTSLIILRNGPTLAHLISGHALPMHCLLRYHLRPGFLKGSLLVITFPRIYSGYVASFLSVCLTPTLTYLKIT